MNSLIVRLYTIRALKAAEKLKGFPPTLFFFLSSSYIFNHLWEEGEIIAYFVTAAHPTIIKKL